MSCVNDGDSLLTDLHPIENHITSIRLYWLFLNHFDIDEVCEVIRPVVTNDENALLFALLTNEKIKKTGFLSSVSSAPEPYGFLGLFYHHY